MSKSRLPYGWGKPSDNSLPAAALTINVLRQRPLLIVAAACVGVATLISLAVARWSAVGWKQAADELHLTKRALQRVVGEHQLGFLEVEQAIQNVVRDYGYLDKPLNSAALETLANGRSYFARYIEQNRDDPATIPARARACQNLGDINGALGLVAQAEAEYREARYLLEGLSRESPDPAIRIMLAATNKSLGCLLVTTGRAADAERLASEAVVGLESSLAQDPTNWSARVELCHASRNLGLILAVLGRDGTKEVSRSITETSLAASEAPDEIMIAEYLVDTHQVLVQLLWRQGRFSEAEQACLESIQAIDRLLADFLALADRKRTSLRLLKYRKARAMAQSNLQRLRRQSEKDAPSADSWQWSPLVRLPGQIVQADMLVHGSLPGEFERQHSLLLAWLDEEWCKETLVKMIVETHQHVQIIILVEDDLIEDEASEALREAKVALDRVRFHHVPTNTLWVRDFGPVVIDTGDGAYKCVAAPRTFNLKDPRLEDDHASLALSRLFDIPVIPARFILEGGAVLSNGAGLCVVSSGLLEKNALLGYPEPHITNTIKRLFGAEQVIYLEPLYEEPTGHVDWFATFTSSHTIVVGDYRGIDPVNASLLDRHAERLAGVITATGPLKVVRVPMPPRGEGYFGGTYTNVVFANGVLLVPSCPEAPPGVEQEAFDVFRRLLPGWRVVGIDCRKLIVRRGALHCAAVNLYRVAPRSASGVNAG